MSKTWKFLKEKFPDYLEFLKEWYRGVGAFILFVGGAIQFFSLLLISPYYLRFFSVTQLIADGLLACFFVLILSFFFLLIYVSISVRDESIWYYLNEAILIFTVFWIFDFSSSFFLISFIFYFFLSVDAFPFWYLFFVKPKVESPKKIKNKYFRWFLISVLAMLHILALIYYSYSFPAGISKFMNQKILEIKVGNESKMGNVKMLYFNDKYVFIQGDEGVIVYKNDVLFEDF